VTHRSAILLLALTTLAQAVAIIGGPLPGAVAYAVAFLATLNAAALSVEPQARWLLQAVALVPLAQLVALSVPPADMDLALRYMLVAVPMAGAVIAAARGARIGLRDLGFRIRLGGVALAIAMSPGCVALGLFAYDLVKPLPIVRDMSRPTDLLIAFTAFAVGAMVEAALFRGLLQTYASRVFGIWRGMAYASILFAVVSVLGASPAILIVGLYAAFMFGFATIATGSIYPAAAGQLTLNTSMFILGPMTAG
jgi:membrane protease YdiL (CAAX protease family)